MRFESTVALTICLLAFGCNKDSKSTSGVPEAANGDVASGSNADDPEKDGETGAGNDSSKSPGQLPLSCRIAVDCQQPLPELPAPTGFKNSENTLRAALKNGVHRGRDFMAVEGQDPILIAKFAYTLAIDADVKGEDVDIYMSKGCDIGWVNLGTHVTSDNSSKVTLDGVEDTGGYIMMPLSKLGVTNLPVGRHRFLFVLKGNNDMTELYVEIMPKKNAVVVTDIDGTLTAFEEAAAVEVLGFHPESHPGAADMIRSFYHRGYNIFYLTARPSFLVAQTREWLNMRGFPPGVIHTTTFKTGATGDAAAAFKVSELAQLKTNTGVVPSYSFGNKPSDVKAFGDSGIAAENSYFFKIQGDTTGAKVNDDYRTLVPMAQAAPSLCP